MNQSRWSAREDLPDPPSRHHLPFDKLMALSKAEGPFDRLTVLSKVEGLRLSASGGLPSRQRRASERSSPRLRGGRLAAY